MKRMNKQEFDLHKKARKFSREQCEKYSLIMKVRNGQYIDPKKLKK